MGWEGREEGRGRRVEGWKKAEDQSGWEGGMVPGGGGFGYCADENMTAHRNLVHGFCRRRRSWYPAQLYRRRRLHRTGTGRGMATYRHTGANHRHRPTDTDTASEKR